MQDKFALTVIYAPNELVERYLLWDKLVALKSQVSGPWLLVGDFNNVLHSAERIGGVQASYLETMPFQTCLADCDLEDIKKMVEYSHGPMV